MELDSSNDTSGMAKVVYILYLIGIVVGITTLVGVIIAYVNHGEAPSWLKSHYRFQIRTFWIGFLYSVIAMILLPVLIGWVLFLVILVWLIVRCVKGLNWMEQRAAVPDPTTWGF
ncbi:MAG: DUF4870 family protein [bacterium]